MATGIILSMNVCSLKKNKNMTKYQRLSAFRSQRNPGASGFNGTRNFFGEKFEIWPFPNLKERLPYFLQSS